MTKEENPQTQKTGFPSFLESANPALPTFPPHGYCCCSRFNTQSKPQPRFVLATFPTYPQIPRRRLQKWYSAVGSPAAVRVGSYISETRTRQ